MAAEDYIPDHAYEDDGEREHRSPVCKHCGVAGLTWIHTGVRWRLADGKGLHTCATKPSASDFDVIDT